MHVLARDQTSADSVVRYCDIAVVALGLFEIGKDLSRFPVYYTYPPSQS